MFKPIAHSYHRRSYLQTFLHSLWNDIPALVITHIGMGISYGSKNILPMLFCIELVVTFLFTLRYDIPFIREMRKSKVSRKFLDIMAIIIQMVGVVILSLFVLLAVVQ